MSFYLRQSVVHGQVHVSHRGRRRLIRRLQQRGPRAKAVASRPLRLRSHTGTSPGPRQVVALENIRTVEEWPDCCVIVKVCCTQGGWHIKRRFKLDPPLWNSVQHHTCHFESWLHLRRARLGSGSSPAAPTGQNDHRRHSRQSALRSKQNLTSQSRVNQDDLQQFLAAGRCFG